MQKETSASLRSLRETMLVLIMDPTTKGPFQIYHQTVSHRPIYCTTLQQGAKLPLVHEAKQGITGRIHDQIRNILARSLYPQVKILHRTLSSPQAEHLAFTIQRLIDNQQYVEAQIPDFYTDSGVSIYHGLDLVQAQVIVDEEIDSWIDQDDEQIDDQDTVEFNDQEYDEDAEYDDFSMDLPVFSPDSRAVSQSSLLTNKAAPLNRSSSVLPPAQTTKRGKLRSIPHDSNVSKHVLSSLTGDASISGLGPTDSYIYDQQRTVEDEESTFLIHEISRMTREAVTGAQEQEAKPCTRTPVLETVVPKADPVLDALLPKPRQQKTIAVTDPFASHVDVVPASTVKDLAPVEPVADKPKGKRGRPRLPGTTKEKKAAADRARYARNQDLGIGHQHVKSGGSAADSAPSNERPPGLSDREWASVLRGRKISATKNAKSPEEKAKITAKRLASRLQNELLGLAPTSRKNKNKK
jgi:hypothetical protein